MYYCELTCLFRNRRQSHTLEHLIHDSLALFVANEASSVAQEGTNNTRSESREERLHTSGGIDLLCAIHEALILTLRLDNAIDLQLRLHITEGDRSHLHNIDGVNASPVRHSANTSSHELREHALILHVGERLSFICAIYRYLTLLQHHATVPLINTKVEGDGDHVTKKSGAETLVAAKNAVHVDDLLDAARHRRELRLVLRIRLRTNNLDLDLGLEQVHGGFHEGDRHTSASSGNKGLGEGKDRSVANNLLHLSVRQELHSVEDHVAYNSRLHTRIPQRGETNPL